VKEYMDEVEWMKLVNGNGEMGIMDEVGEIDEGLW